MLLGTIDLENAPIDRVPRLIDGPTWTTVAEVLGRPRVLRGVQRISSGIKSIDAFLDGGFPQGGLTTIVGRTGGCKSQFAANVAHGAARDGPPALLFSLEDDLADVALRLIAQDSKIFLNKLRKGTEKLLNPRDMKSFREARDRIGNLEIRLSDERDWEEMRSLMALHAKQQGGLVLIDYLGCMMLGHGQGEYSGGGSEFERVTMAMRLLESAARECDLAIVVFAQVNREATASSNLIELHQTRDSGFVEQLSSIVIALERPREAAAVDPRFRNDCGSCASLPIRVLKNRWGQVHKPVVVDVPTGRRRSPPTAHRIREANYEHIALAWYPGLHLIEDPVESSIPSGFECECKQDTTLASGVDINDPVDQETSPQ